MFRDWCKKCEFPRYIEGYRGPADYIANGWVMFVTTTIKKTVSGITNDGQTTEWLCPACAEEIEQGRKTLMDIGSARQINRRGVLVDERST